jgi:histidinol-phosphate aminotransferase
MSRFFDLVSKPAREMEGHPAAPQPAVGTPGRLLRLDSNENPFGASPRAIEAMQARLASANSYPDDDCTELRNKLATYHAVAPEQVFVAAGSTALLGLLCQTMLGPGLNAVTSQRSFIVYSMAVHVSGAQLIEVPMRGDSFDLDAMLQAIQDNTRLVFLANPNNPTGTMLEAADVYKFVAAVPGHVVVVLDEAYYEFAEHFASLRGVEYTRSLEYVRAGAGVIVLRTFSKAHGLAGLRVGYGLGPAELLAYCAHMRSQFSVSSLALTAAEAALDDQNHIGGVVSSNAVQAALLQEGFAQLGYRVVPTAANFVYCDVGEDAAGWAERLRKEGVSVRPLGTWGAPNCIRVTVGTPEQNQFFLSAARRISGAPPRTIVI